MTLIYASIWAGVSGLTYTYFYVSYYKDT